MRWRLLRCRSVAKVRRDLQCDSGTSPDSSRALESRPAGRTGENHQQGAGEGPQTALPTRVGHASGTTAVEARTNTAHGVILQRLPRRPFSDSSSAPHLIVVSIRRHWFVVPSRAVRPDSGVSIQPQSESAHSSGSSVVIAAAKHHKGPFGNLGCASADCRRGIRRVLATSPTEPGRSHFKPSTSRNSQTRAKLLLAAISPDGKYVVSVVDDNGKQSLWLRNVPSGSNTQVLEPDTLVIQSPVFSPDGSYIFYRKAADAAQTTFRRISNASARRHAAILGVRR